MDFVETSPLERIKMLIKGKDKLNSYSFVTDVF